MSSVNSLLATEQRVVKQLILDLAARDRVLQLAAPLGRTRATILMAHRFADAERGTPGLDATALRTGLELLRRHKFNIVPLADLVRQLRQGDLLPPRTVAFTVDDGYADFGRIAAPVFAAYDCPVTVFVTTGFVDRALWNWWDKLEFVMRHSARSGFTLEVHRLPLRESWFSEEERALVQARVTELLKVVPEEHKQEAITALADALAVELPADAPLAYAAMTWDEIRACERSGTSFGPHTVTHPILSRVSAARAEAEIRGSWERLRAGVSSPDPVFCYPSGTPGSFSDRDGAIVRDLGLLGAVSAFPGYVRHHDYRGPDSPRLFDIPRFGYPEQERLFRHIIFGLQSAKLWLGRLARGRRLRDRSGHTRLVKDYTLMRAAD